MDGDKEKVMDPEGSETERADVYACVCVLKKRLLFIAWITAPRQLSAGDVSSNMTLPVKKAYTHTHTHVYMCVRAWVGTHGRHIFSQSKPTWLTSQTEWKHLSVSLSHRPVPGGIGPGPPLLGPFVLVALLCQPPSRSSSFPASPCRGFGLREVSETGGRAAGQLQFAVEAPWNPKVRRRETIVSTKWDWTTLMRKAELVSLIQVSQTQQQPQKQFLKHGGENTYFCFS